MQTIIPLALVTGVMLTVGVSFLSLAVLFYRDSLTHLHRQQVALLKRLRRTRLADVLLRQGVPLGGHVRLTKPSLLKQQIRRCQHCPHVAECSHSLRFSAAVPIAACPNREHIERAAARSPERYKAPPFRQPAAAA